MGEEQQALFFDLDDLQPPIAITSGLPDFSLRARPLAGGSGWMLVAGSNEGDVSAYGGPQQLFFVDRRGATRAAGSTGGNLPVGLAATTARSVYDGSRIALITGQRNGGCSNYGWLNVFRPDGDIRTGMSIVLPRPDGQNVDDGVYVRDLWWGDDGMVHVVAEAWGCKYGDAGMSTVFEAMPLSEWRLEIDNWAKVRDGPLLARRQLNETTSIVVVPEGKGATGTLYLDADGRRSRIETGVFAISVPAPENARSDPA